MQGPRSPLASAIQRRGTASGVAAALSGAGGGGPVTDAAGFTALHVACLTGWAELLDKLLEVGAELGSGGGGCSTWEQPRVKARASAECLCMNASAECTSPPSACPHREVTTTSTPPRETAGTRPCTWPRWRATGTPARRCWREARAWPSHRAAARPPSTSARCRPRRSPRCRPCSRTPRAAPAWSRRWGTASAPPSCWWVLPRGGVPAGCCCCCPTPADRRSICAPSPAPSDAPPPAQALVCHGQADVVRMLLVAGADPSEAVPSQNNVTALHTCAHLSRWAGGGGCARAPRRAVLHSRLARCSLLPRAARGTSASRQLVPRPARPPLAQGGRPARAGGGGRRRERHLCRRRVGGAGALHAGARGRGRKLGGPVASLAGQAPTCAALPAPPALTPRVRCCPCLPAPQAPSRQRSEAAKRAMLKVLAEAGADLNLVVPGPQHTGAWRRVLTSGRDACRVPATRGGCCGAGAEAPVGQTILVPARACRPLAVLHFAAATCRDEETANLLLDSGGCSWRCAAACKALLLLPAHCRVPAAFHGLARSTWHPLHLPTQAWTQALPSTRRSCWAAASPAKRAPRCCTWRRSAAGAAWRRCSWRRVRCRLSEGRGCRAHAPPARLQPGALLRLNSRWWA